MEIKHLSLVVTEHDLNELAKKHLPSDFPVVHLTMRLSPNGLAISGEYPMVVRIPFETLWTVEVNGGKVIARLTNIRALKLPVTVFRGMILKLIREYARHEPWLEQRQDMLIVDVEKLLEDGGIFLQLNLREIHCLNGHLLLHAGDAVL